MACFKTGAAGPPVPRHGLTPLVVPPPARGCDALDAADPPTPSGPLRLLPRQPMLRKPASRQRPAALPAGRPLVARDAVTLLPKPASAQALAPACVAALHPLLRVQSDSLAAALLNRMALDALAVCTDSESRAAAVRALAAPLLRAVADPAADGERLRERVRLLTWSLVWFIGADPLARLDDLLEALHSLPSRPDLRQAALDGLADGTGLGSAVKVSHWLAGYFMQPRFWQGEGDYGALGVMETLVRGRLLKPRGKDEKAMAGTTAPAEAFFDRVNERTQAWPATDLMEVAYQFGRIIIASKCDPGARLLSGLVLDRAQPRNTVLRMKALAQTKQASASGREALLALRDRWLSAATWKGEPAHATWLGLLAVGWEAGIVAGCDGKKAQAAGDWDQLAAGAQSDEVALWEAGRAIGRDPLQALAPGGAVAEAAARAPGRDADWVARHMLGEMSRYMLYAMSRLAALPDGEPFPDDFASRLGTELRAAGRPEEEAESVLRELRAFAGDQAAPLRRKPSGADLGVAALPPGACAGTSGAGPAVAEARPAPVQSASASIAS